MKKFHLGIYGIVKQNNEILFIKKSRGPYISQLDFPGGKPEHGETIFQTLKREIFEETRVKIFSATALHNEAFVVEYKENGDNILLHHTVLIYQITGFDAANFQSDIQIEDSKGAVWVPKSEIKNQNISRVVKCVF